jgi:predicted dithiol-disulfide oxidoreductase (DUF899 family)
VNGNAADIKQRVAFKVLGRSPLPRQIAFAQERGWHDLNFVATVGDDYAKDIGGPKKRRIGMGCDHRVQARRR